MKERLITYNVADTATPPTVKPHEAEFFELETVRDIIECLQREPLKWRTITLLLINTGARRGEIMGLKWSAINFEENQIEIKSNLLYTKARGVYEDTPKTDKIRFVSIDPHVTALLKMHRNLQKKQKEDMGEEWNDLDYCFTQYNGCPMHPDSITNYLNKFSKKYDLPHIHPHKFRHTQASILYGENIDPITIANRLGHSKPSTTQNMYAHLLSKADAKANQAVSSVIFKDSPFPRVANN